MASCFGRQIFFNACRPEALPGFRGRKNPVRSRTTQRSPAHRPSKPHDPHSRTVLDVDPENIHTTAPNNVDAVRTVLGVPMAQRDALLGVILIYRLGSPAFTTTRSRLLKPLPTKRHRDREASGCSKRAAAHTRSSEGAGCMADRHRRRLKVISRSDLRSGRRCSAPGRVGGALCERSQPGSRGEGRPVAVLRLDRGSTYSKSKSRFARTT